MGKIVSTLSKDVNDVATGIAQAVSDVATTVDQVTAIAAQFSGTPVKKVALAGDIELGAEDNDQMLAEQIKKAMANAQKAVEKKFKTQFPDDEAPNTDKGVIQNYCGGGSNIDLSGLKVQLKNDFSNWAMAADEKAINAMANTISTEVQAQMGAAGTSHGTQNVDMNESIDWIVAYGEFQITTESKGLVYAFGAVYNSGF